MSSNYFLYIILVGGFVLLYSTYSGFLFWQAAKRSALLILATPPYNLSEPARLRHILVLGDSLAVGVGAPPQKTIAALLGTALQANVENVAVSGAQTRDLAGQMERASRDRYDLILIQIGANDVIRLKSLKEAERNMSALLARAQSASDRVVFLTAGNIGDAPLWPWPLSSLYTVRTLNLREKFMALGESYDALYVDIYAHGNLFASDPARYYAVDNLHLSEEGYLKWFEIIDTEIRARWPEIGSW